MKIKTERFGELDVEEKDIYTFKKGLLAFEHLQKYVLIDIVENPAFKWLQPIDNPRVVFLLVDPFLVKKDYYVDIDDYLKTELEIEKQKDVLIYTIVTLPDTGFKDATTNLVGPLVLNIKKRKGKQIVLERDDLAIKYPLFPQKHAEKVSCGG